jgi:hypothetical protein
VLSSPYFQASEAVDLDLVLLGELVRDEECAHVLALVTLQLQHLAELLVLNHGAVAAVFCRLSGEKMHKGWSKLGRGRDGVIEARGEALKRVTLVLGL